MTVNPDRALLAHADVTPDEVRRLNLAPQEYLVIRVADRYSPGQLIEYQRWLETAFPGARVRVVTGEELLVLDHDPAAGPDA